MKRTAIAAAVWATLAAAGVWAQPDEVTLRLRREPGQVLRYRAKVSGIGDITMLDEEQRVTVRGRFIRVERTLSQAGPGTWEVRVTIEEPTLTLGSGGKRETLTMQVPPLTQVVNDRGRVLEIRGWEPQEAAVAAPGMGEAVRPLFGLIQEQGLPERPLKPGDEWTARAKLKMPDGADLEVPQRFELVGFEDVAGVTCAKLRSTSDIPVRRELPPNAIGMRILVEGTERIETTSLLAHEQGKLLRQETAITLDLETSTVLTPEAPDRVVPGAISLRVSVTLELER